MENQESKIRKGQAFNLAVNDAISKSKQSDPRYIYQQFIYYHELAGIVQSSDLDMIAEVLNKPDFEAAVKQLKKTLEG